MVINPRSVSRIWGGTNTYTSWWSYFQDKILKNHSRQWNDRRRKNHSPWKSKFFDIFVTFFYIPTLLPISYKVWDISSPSLILSILYFIMVGLSRDRPNPVIWGNWTIFFSYLLRSKGSKTGGGKTFNLGQTETRKGRNSLSSQGGNSDW